MANITYRVNSNPAIPGTSTVKGTPLTNVEVDANFRAIDIEVDQLNSSTVRLTGDQTIAGVKTFSSPPVVPADSFSFAQLQNIPTGTILGRAGAGNGDIEGLSQATAMALLAAVGTTGDQTIAGVKTFSSPIAGSVTGSAGSVSGTVAIANGGTGQTSAPAALAALGGGPQLAPINATVASNALTITLNPTALAFRSPSHGSGIVSMRTVSAPISLTVSSGSTLGTTNGVHAHLAVLALDNAGTVELAVVNLAGSVSLDEIALISTAAEGGAGAADSASTVYSTTARAQVPYRLLGFVGINQTTAGTWAAPPGSVHASVPLAMWLSGFGQTWQLVHGSRALATTYTNTTGRPIAVSVVTSNATGFTPLTATVGGSVMEIGRTPPIANGTASSCIIVPASATYSISMGNSPALIAWTELR